jgi:putative peptidoglycan lipid II flippase
LSDFIIHIVYERGAFSSNDTIKTSACLACFSIGLPAFILNKVLTPIFYANNDQRSPFKISAYSLMADVVMSIVLMYFWRASGIALAASLGAWFNCALLLKICKRKGYFDIKIGNIWPFILKILLTNSIMAIVLIVSKGAVYQACYQASMIIKLLALSGMILVGFTTYLISSLMCGIIAKQDVTKLF